MMVLPKTTVVNKKFDKFDVYIGRPSKWGNPFLIGRDGSRFDVIAKYETYFFANKDLMRDAKTELRGKRLGCYCFPMACHGDILAKYVNEKV